MPCQEYTVKTEFTVLCRRVNMKETMIKRITTIVIIILLHSCSNNKETNINLELGKQDFIKTIQKHLDAVSKRDLESLKSTLSPTSEMQLILPKSEILNSVDAFMQYHQDWFAIPDWTFETKILNTKVGTQLGMAVVEITYREPLREGKPYFNRMNVSYVLEKINGQWYVIKDHASSIEKSTD
jgi:ketosteroid isomerase-like protein